MEQKMPARGETGYAVFLTVSGGGIQFPALYRSTCRALTEGKAMEGFRVAEAENRASPETGEVSTLTLRERI